MDTRFTLFAVVIVLAILPAVSIMAAAEATVCEVVKTRDFDKLRKMIDADERAREKEGSKEAVMGINRVANTVLHVAAEEGDVATAAFALEAGADIDDNTYFLDCICPQGDPRESGWRESGMGCEVPPPLHRTLLPVLPDMMEFLLDNGADPDVQDLMGAAALHKLANHSLGPGLRGGTLWGDSDFVAAMQLLLKHGADPNIRDSADRTPLHKLGWEDAEAKAELLLKAGADPNARDSYGWTPLTYLDGLVNAGLALRKAGASP